MNAEEFFGDWGRVIPFDILKQSLNKLSERMQTESICPSPELLFEAFKKCNYNNLKVVFLGQSPYPQKGVATGLCFANKKDVDKMSPSLQVLYDSVDKYCTDDLPFSTIDKVFPDLEYWANQGMLLLNSSLSIKEGDPDSHTEIWRKFIGTLLQNISKDKPDTIFVLFGEVAKTFICFIENNNYICTVHPAACARRGTLLPNIFAEIDRRMIERNISLIYWI